MSAPLDEKCESEIDTLKRRLEEKEREIEELRQTVQRFENGCGAQCSSEKDLGDSMVHPREMRDLSNEEISRYSRQLILPEIGVTGQKRLASTAVLIVGAGGLGCPVALYLAAAGLGCLGIVDYDEVELSNLHRQVLHTESRVGVAKSLSVSQGCQQLNSAIKCIPYHMQLNSDNALPLIRQYDIIVDATDNVATRYLLNDACVIEKKPLVSGSALRFEGQLTVYNYNNGPCYRCLYPTPPPPETVTNCSDGGVLGVVPGIIGCFQALEVIKIATQSGTTFSQRLLLFDGLDGTIRCIKLRPRQTSCAVCGNSPSITHLIDYEQFCGARASDKTKSLDLLSAGERISAQEYKSLQDTGHILVDVRQPVEMDICQLPGSLNIPIDKIQRDEALSQIQDEINIKSSDTSDLPVYVVCRLGNDSQKAVRVLQEKLSSHSLVIKDIRGGLLSWSKNVDPSFPRY